MDLRQSSTSKVGWKRSRITTHKLDIVSWPAPLFLLLFFCNNTSPPCTALIKEARFVGRTEQMGFQVHITLPVTLDRHGYDTAAAGHAHGAAPELTAPTFAGTFLKTALTLSWPTSHRQLEGALKAWEASALRTLAALHPTCHRQVGDTTPQPQCGQTAKWWKGLAVNFFRGTEVTKCPRLCHAERLVWLGLLQQKASAATKIIQQINWFELFTQLEFVPWSVHMCVFTFLFPLCLLILGPVPMRVMFRSCAASVLRCTNILNSLGTAHPWHSAVSSGTAVPLLLSKDVCGVSDCLALCCC